MRVTALMNMGQAGKALGLAGAVATFADLAQPVAPVSSYVLVISLLILTALMVTRFMVGKWNDVLSITSYFAVISLVFSVFLMIYQNANPQAKRLGVMGAHIPGIVEMQKSLGMVNKKLAHISKKVDSIDKKIGKLKKETSDDPRKELFNMGITWDQASFYKTASRGDLKNFDLFLKGGMNPDPVVIRLFTQQAPNTYKVLQHLIKNKYDINKLHTAWSRQYDLAGMAIVTGNSKALRLLLDKGVNRERAKTVLRDRLMPLSNKINNMCFSLKRKARARRYYSSHKMKNSRLTMYNACRQAVPSGQEARAKNYYDTLVKIHTLLYSKPYQPPLMADKTLGMAYAMMANKPGLLDRYLKAGGNASARVNDPESTSLISFAMESDKPLDMVSRLIIAGADVNAAQKNGDTPLLIFVRNQEPEVVRLLLKHKADVNRLNRKKITPFVAAVLYNQIPVVKEMLKHGANVNARDSRRFPMLYSLMQSSRQAMFKLLLEHGSSPDARLGEKLNSVMVEAIQRNNVWAVELLLKHKVKLLTPGRKSYEILHTAINQGKSLKIVEMLLKHGANPNYRTNQGFSGLDFVVSRFGYKGVKLMLDHGADPMIKTYDGRPTLEHYRNKSSEKAKQIFRLMESRLKNRK